MSPSDKRKIVRMDSFSRSSLWNPFESKDNLSEHGITEFEEKVPYQPVLTATGSSSATLSPNEFQGDPLTGWIQEQQGINTPQTDFIQEPKFENEDDNEFQIDEATATEDSEEQITLFQGFRALHPKSSRNFKEKEQQIQERQQETKKSSLHKAISALSINGSKSANSGSLHGSGAHSKSHRLPPRTRHQAISINNIAKIFTELLNEREELLLESEDIEYRRACILIDIASCRR
jgi:hypothetical protein